MSRSMTLVAILVVSLVRLQRLRRRHKDDPFVWNLATCLQASLIGYVCVGSFASIGTIELPYIALAMTVGLENILVQELPQPVLEPTPARRRKARLSLSRTKPATT